MDRPQGLWRSAIEATSTTPIATGVLSPPSTPTPSGSPPWLDPAGHVLTFAVLGFAARRTDLWATQAGRLGAMTWFAASTEVLQHAQLQRTGALDDLAADVVGAAAGLAIASLLAEGQSRLAAR